MSALWPEVAFSDLFEISSSKRVLESQWTTSGVPFYRAREIVKLSSDGEVNNELFISEELFSELRSKSVVPAPGDLVVSAVGTLGACYVVQKQDRFYFKDASVLLFRPKTELDARFIWHAFQTRSIREQVHAGSGSTVGTYTITRANQTKLRLPPIAEQHRIAELLDRAQALCAKRQQALVKLGELEESIFFNLFGDATANLKFKVVELAAICGKVTDGTHQSPTWARSGVPFLFQSNVKPGFISFDTKRSISLTDWEGLTKRCPIEYGDILYTVVGSYGNAAMVRTREPFGFQRHIAQLKPSAKVLPEFLEAMMNQPFIKRQADERVTGIAQKTLILKELKRLLVMEPPMALQMRFRDIRNQVAVLRINMERQAAVFTAQFHALQDKAFTGTL